MSHPFENSLFFHGMELMFSEVLLQQPHPEPHTLEREREEVIFHVEVPFCHNLQTPNSA